MKIIRYFKPRKRLHSVPKMISANYQRAGMSEDASALLTAGLARDPAGAEELAKALESEHGKAWREKIHLKLYKDNPRTFAERLLILCRRIMGESDEIVKFKKMRRSAPVVLTQFKFRGNDD